MIKVKRFRRYYANAVLTPSPIIKTSPV